MEKANYRRVIQLGKTTHCISLPKTWLEKNGISKGDTILIDTKPNGDLTLIPNSKTQTYEKEITIDTKDKRLEEIKRNIIAAYINDYTKINITGKNVEKQLTHISKVLELLTATEIMQVEKDKITINSFFDANNASIKNVLTRLNMMIISLFAHIKNIMIHNEKSYGFLRRENEINRVCFMGFRVLSHALNNTNQTCFQGKDEKDFIETWMMIDKLEKIADRLYSIGRILESSKNLQNTGKQCKKNIINLISKIENAYKEVVLSFNKYDRKVAHKIIDLCQENSKLCNNELLKHHDKNIVIVLVKLNRISTITKHIGMIIIDMQPID